LVSSDPTGIDGTSLSPLVHVRRVEEAPIWGLMVDVGVLLPVGGGTTAGPR
jgi:hypothetical protein